jgi:hypothetical protein
MVRDSYSQIIVVSVESVDTEMFLKGTVKNIGNDESTHALSLLP